MKYFGLAILTLFFAVASPCYAQVLSQPDSATVSGSSQEQFSSASMASSSLHADPPVLVDTEEESAYVSEWITVQWRPNDPIYLFVIRPRGVTKPPAVIYLYDYPQETDTFRDDDWCQRATAGGYAAVGFVPALTGHRYHSRPMKEWFVSELQESLATTAHDVQMVITYLEQRGDLDNSRIGIYGIGAGATIAALAASVDSRIKAVELVDPWGDWPTWMKLSDVVPEEERPLFLTPQFLAQVASFDPLAVLPNLKTPRVRLVQFAQGSATPELAKRRIADALTKTHELSRYSTVAEFDRSNDSGAAKSWIKLQLAPQSKAVARKASSVKSSGPNADVRRNGK